MATKTTPTKKKRGRPATGRTTTSITIPIARVAEVRAFLGKPLIPKKTKPRGPHKPKVQSQSRFV